MSFPKRLLMLAGVAAIASLSACKDNPLHDPVDSMEGMKSQTEHHLSTEASDDLAAGKTEDALRLYARLHKEHPRDRGTALVYAQLLRKTGRPAEAVAVLTPFASYTTRSNDATTVVVFSTDATVLNELAAAHIATGNFAAAQPVLQRVLDDPDSAPRHADAYSLMGIVMDAQGKHQDAEKMFNHALEGWKGDPTPVMNNLALCLAAQGQFDQALDTLRRALVTSPNDKQEIARNIALITDLRSRVVAHPVVVEKKVVVQKTVKKTVKKAVHHKKPAACGPCPVPAPKDDKKQ